MFKWMEVNLIKPLVLVPVYKKYQNKNTHMDTIIQIQNMENPTEQMTWCFQQIINSIITIYYKWHNYIGG